MNRAIRAVTIFKDSTENLLKAVEYLNDARDRFNISVSRTMP